MAIVGIDTLSLLDYEDKVACVIFFKACNFRCPFCHNGTSVLEAIDSIDFQEVIDSLKKRIGLIDAVVFSGGEPTLERDIVNKIKRVKDLGFLVKLDTNGTKPEVIEKLLDEQLVDYIAMDIKNSPALYAKTSGVNRVDLDSIKKSIALIIKRAPDYEFRTTLVKEFHELMDVEQYLALIKGAKKLYLQKFVDREECFQKGLHEVDILEAERLKEILKDVIPRVELRGY
ncbi:MAG: anaerobic ribonucleoside-triphosphate reductase activating protein [Erysipelotrichia bacterium]|nr:anaerobic ribonucleoside-triphosphate reductase activating protein [Erysipelotrichia bacterium]